MRTRKSPGAEPVAEKHPTPSTTDGNGHLAPGP